ncbi:MAG: DUF72 domain-containing protein [Anaerolineae bacterium]
MSRIFIGACSWSDFTRFYPAGLPANHQIGYYAQRFSLVEIDSTYYRIMPARNFALWAERTPPGFVFDVKAFQQLTFHDREHLPTREVAEQFSASVQPLRDAGKLGALHFQFAPWFTYGAGNLEYLASLRSQYFGDGISVEMRHRSWYETEAYQKLTAALRETSVGLTVVDEPQVGSGSVPTVIEVTDPSLVLVRLHGRNAKTWYMRTKTPAERFNYLYSEEELRAWVPSLAQLAELAQTIHVLFNNNYQDYAIENGIQLRTLLRQSLPQVQVTASPDE